MDFSKVNKVVLTKYKQRFDLKVTNVESKVAVARAIEEHFEHQQVNEHQVIAQFLYCVRNMSKFVVVVVVVSELTLNLFSSIVFS
jgi:hypothetical protein